MAKQTPWQQVIVLDIRETDSGELPGLATLTLALGIVYRMMRERDDRISGAKMPAG